MTHWSTKGITVFLGLLAVLGLGYTTLTTPSTHAADSLLEALGGGTTAFGANITTSGITNNSVEIVFPVYSSNGVNIMNYEVNYVKGASISTADMNAIQKVTFSNENIQIVNGNIVLKLTGLEANSTYYYVIAPINNEGGMLSRSDEQSFTTAAGTTINAAAETQIDATLGAADISTANFTHTLSGNKVTMKWNAISGASKFIFTQKEATASSYSNIGEELISKESFTFVLGKVGLYSIKIVPVDSNGLAVGAEKVMTVKITSVDSTPGKGTPSTGPMLNLVLMSTFLLMLVYVVYRFRTTK